LPDPDEIAEDIVENLESALEEFKMVVEDLGKSKDKGGRIGRGKCD